MYYYVLYRLAVLNYFIGLVSIYSTVQIASEIFIGRILGKVYQSVLVQMKCLKFSRREQLGDEYYSIILGIIFSSKVRAL